MSSGIAGRAVVPVTFLMTFLFGAVAPVAADTGDDALLVYCLATDQRDKLVDAAVALGLAVRSGDRLEVGDETMTVPTWRERHPDDFFRTCQALSAAQRPQGPSAFVIAMPFLTGVTGAILAFAAALSLARVNRGRERADQLRSAFDEFRQAVEAYIDGWDKVGLRTTAVERRGVLLTRLAVIQAAHGRWAAVETIVHELVDGDVGQAIAGQPPDDDGALVAVLMSLRGQVFRLARALEQPLWAHPAMRSAEGGTA